MKYKSKLGTMINIPDGLSDKQIAAIKKDADAGYGTRAQKTANDLGKKLGKTPGVKPGAPESTQGPTTTNYFDKDGGLKDPDAVVSNLKPTPDMKDLQGNIDSARQGMYSYLTRNYEADKAKELELAKQELSNRGIPYSPDTAYDPNTKDLYGQTIGGINRSYQDKYDQASAQAYSDSLSQGTNAFNAAVGAAGQGNDSFVNLILGMTDADLKKYGINKDYQAKMAAVAKAGSGGGKASGGGGGGGFEIVG